MSLESNSELKSVLVLNGLILNIYTNLLFTSHSILKVKQWVVKFGQFPFVFSFKTER